MGKFDIRNELAPSDPIRNHSRHGGFSHFSTVGRETYNQFEKFNFMKTFLATVKIRKSFPERGDG